jgi:hypothetical protein
MAFESFVRQDQVAKEMVDPTNQACKNHRASSHSGDSNPAQTAA